MKIYGKEFDQIFADIPWTYKIVVVCGTAFIIFSIVYCTYTFFHFTGTVNPKSEPPTNIYINGTDNGGGILDPAMTSDGRGNDALAFTFLAPIYNMPENAPYHYFNIMLTLNVGKCTAWAPIDKPLFTGGPDIVMGPDGLTPLAPGDWRYETPGIVYDPDDKGKEWKVFAYKYYINKAQGISQLYSAIVYKHAPDPHGPWSDEEWLLSASPERPPQPYSGLVHQYISQMSPAVANLSTFSRPSVIYTGGVLFMSLSAFQQGFADPVGIIMLASTDHGKNWQYIGTLMTMQDAKNIGQSQSVPADYKLGGGNLFTLNGKIYLSVVFGDDKTAGLGAFIMEVENPAKATLVRDDKTGIPVVLNQVKPNTISKNALGGGYLAYSDACGDKIGALESEYSSPFHQYVMFRTNHSPLEPITDNGDK